MRIILLLTLFLSTFAQADKLIVGGVSHHFKEIRCEFNETHPAIGLERNGYEAGVYKNSIEKTSFFIAKIEKPFHKFGLDFGYRIGAATGYNGVYECDGKLLLFKNKDGYFTRYDKKEDVFDNYKGIMPQASLLISKETKYITVDLGISLVSTVIFKVNL
jgi:hypothetical protein